MVGAETIPPLVCGPIVMNSCEKKGFTICGVCSAVKILVAHERTKEIFYAVVIVLVFAGKKKIKSGIDKALNNGSQPLLEWNCFCLHFTTTYL